MLLLLIAVSLVSVRLLTGCGEGLNIFTEDSVNSADNNGIEPEEPVINWSDWSYRRSVTISNGVTEQTDYQINVILDGTFNYSGVASDGSDIRFNYDGVSIPYWIEYWNQSGNSSIWVKVPLIPSGGKVIYMYYGNSGEDAVSDFGNTFTKNSGFSGLVARWHMDEGSGSTIDDSSSNSNDGTIKGATWVGADGGGWYTRADISFGTGDSLNFDGINDNIAISDNDSLDINQLTITGWITTSDDVTNNKFIVSKWAESPNQKSYALYIGSGQVNFLTSNDGDLNGDTLSGGIIAINTMYHIAVTFDGNTKKIYINGSESNSGTWANTIYSGTSSVLIGNRNTSTTNFFKGIIDEVAIYNRALTADEVEALSQRRKDSPDVGDSPTVGSEETVP